MSAHIEVNCSGEETAQFWIEKPVLRIGSSESCDVPVRGRQVAEHAVTIQYRDGGYVAYNRTEAPLRIAERSLAPGESQAWRSGELLHVAPDATLCLLIEGSAAPSRRAPDDTVLKAYQQRRQDERIAQQVQAQVEAASADEARADKPAAAASSLPQVLVGVICFGLALAMLGGIVVMLIEPEKTTTSNPLDDPQKIPDELLKSKAKLPAELVTCLQEAEQAVKRGDATLARRRLWRLRTEVVRRQASGEPLQLERGDQPWDYGQALLLYVNHYLAKLDATKKKR